MPSPRRAQLAVPPTTQRRNRQGDLALRRPEPAETTRHLGQPLPPPASRQRSQARYNRETTRRGSRRRSLGVPGIVGSSRRRSPNSNGAATHCKIVVCRCLLPSSACSPELTARLPAKQWHTRCPIHAMVQPAVTAARRFANPATRFPPERAAARFGRPACQAARRLEGR